MPCVEQGTVSQWDIKGFAAEMDVLEGAGGVRTSPENGLMGCLGGTTGLVLPPLTPGRAFLCGKCGCEHLETRAGRGSGTCSAGDVGCSICSKGEF